MFRIEKAPVSLCFLLFLGACNMQSVSEKISKFNYTYLGRATKKTLRPVEVKGTIEDLPQSTDLNEASRVVNASYYFLLARLFAANGQSDKAIAAYERALGLDAHSPELHYVLAQEYLKKNRLEEGVAMARKTLELDPRHRDAKLLLANLYGTAKKYSEAFQLFQEIEKENPDDEEVMLYMALLEIEQKNLSRAYKRLKDFVSRNEDSALAFFYLGRIEEEKSNTKVAIANYKRALDIRPGFVQAGTYLAYLQEDTGDNAGAIETYTWLANQTDEPAFHRKLGHIYLDQNDFPRALQAFENFQRVDPTDANNLVKLGLLYLELKKFDNALKVFRTVLKENPASDSVRFYYATVLEDLKRKDEAFKEYAQITRESKLFLESLRKQLTLMVEAKKKSEATLLLQDTEFALESEKKLSDEFFELASHHFEATKDRNRAFEKLEEGLKSFPSSIRLLYLKGALLDKEGRSSEAVTFMERILKINPSHVDALNFVGYVWADKGQRLNEAESKIRKALQLRPRDPFITDSLAWVYYHKGDYKKALNLLQDAAAMRADEPVIREHLGDVLVKLGQIEEAIKHYEEALRLGLERESDKQKLEAKLAQLRMHYQANCNARPGSQCNPELFDNAKREPAFVEGSRDQLR